MSQPSTFSPEMSLVYPIFVTNSSEDAMVEISSLPGQYRLGVGRVVEFLRPIVEKGLKAILLFGVMEKESETEKKDAIGSFASSPNNPVIQSLKVLSEAFPELLLICDVCLCAYTSHGHCGIFAGQSEELCFETSGKRIADVCVAYAEAGAHVLAPSDMMEGRIKHIRDALQQRGLNRAVMSYVKAASVFYGPFRDAAKSAPSFGDRKSYQLPPSSRNAFIKSSLRDLNDGADCLLIKPATTMSDCIHAVKTHPDVLVPIAAYQVSGEYAMVYHAAANGAFDLNTALMELYLGLRRAGADIVISYFTPRLLDIFAANQPKK